MVSGERDGHVRGGSAAAEADPRRRVAPRDERLLGAHHHIQHRVTYDDDSTHLVAREIAVAI